MEKVGDFSTPQSEKDGQPPAKKKRSANFDFKDMNILVQIVAKYDPGRVISSANKDAGTIAKKKLIWDKVLMVRLYEV